MLLDRLEATTGRDLLTITDIFNFWFEDEFLSKPDIVDMGQGYAQDQVTETQMNINTNELITRYYMRINNINNNGHYE